MLYGKKRYSGNGRTVYEPDLTGEAWKDALAPGGAKNLAGGAAGLRPAEAGKPASATFAVDLPYVGVDAWLDATVVRKTEADSVTISAKGRTGGWKKIWQAEGTGELKLSKLSLKDAAWFGHGYQVRLEMTAGADPAGAAVRKLQITSVFMNNMYALPYFLPGRNVVMNQ